MSAGTDYETAPGQPFPSLHDELVFLVERCGMPTAQAIRAATLVGALSMGAEDVMGTVAAGKLANFVVLRQDPLSDIRNLRSIDFVVKRGVRLDRADFTTQDDTRHSPEGRTGR